MAITERQMMILKAIIDDYIATGIPVGSRTLSKREDMNISSATIRNEMADLEEGGYLEQPHTSAGRMPSDKAYRLYVDTLMKVSRLNQGEISFIRKYLNQKMGQMGGVIEATAKVLSEMTNLTSLVLAPQLSQIEIRRIQIVKLSGHKALLIFVFNTGMVRDMVIHVPEELDPYELETLSNFLTDKVSNRRFADAVSTVREAAVGDIEAHRAFLESMLDAVQANIRPEAGKEVVLGGAKNIFNHPEYQDVDKAKNFLTLLETKDALYDMLSRSTDMEFTIRIGKENELSELRDMSIVTATYRMGDQKLGSFGVIGPTRMNYAKIISVLRCVSASMNEILQYYLTDDKQY